MTIPGIAIRSAVHYLRRNLAVLTGVSLSAAVIIGALLAGDTVRSSLIAYNTKRLGNVHYVLDAGDRTVTQGLADALSRRITKNRPTENSGNSDFTVPHDVGTPNPREDTFDVRLEPVMHMEAVLSNPRTDIEIADVDIYGVRETFWNLQVPRESEDTARVTLTGMEPGIAVINEAAAGRLGIVPGEELIVRTYPVYAIPGDAPVTAERRILRIPVKVGRIIKVGEGGNFSLSLDQDVPLNLFLDLGYLTRELEIPGRCNLLLSNGGPSTGASGGVPDATVLTESIRDVWTLDDLDLSLKTFPEAGFIELRSRRIFIDSAVSAAAVDAMPAAHRTYTYFVNSIAAADSSIPYSFVSVRPDIAPGEIFLTEWAHEDLETEMGALLRLDYFIPADTGGLAEEGAEFRFTGIIPDLITADLATALPEYPGIAGVDHCLEWRPGIPLELGRIRQKDELFWERYGGAPKAFISLEDADRLWAGRFGNCTSVRFPPGIDRSPIVRGILDEVSPPSVGLEFRDVYTPAVRAGSNSVDFSGLFLALSFFIVAASVILTTLLFGSELHSRGDQFTTLAGLGFPRWKVCLTAILEGGLVTLWAVPIGIFAGIGFVHLLTGALSGVWAGAIGKTPGELAAAGMVLSVGVPYATLVIGAVSGYFLGLVSVVTASYRVVRKVYPDLSNREKGKSIDEEASVVEGASVVCRNGSGPAVLIGGGVAVGLGILMPAAAFMSGFDPTLVFVIAGILTIVGGLLVFYRLLHSGSEGGGARGFGLLQLGFGFAAARRGRSIASAAVIALGIFTVVAVGMNKKGLPQDPEDRSAGTGGFDLFLRSTLPIHEDLSRVLSFTDERSPEVVSFRLEEGDDASCLNLNQVRRPGILGVDADGLASGERFSFERVGTGDLEVEALESVKAVDTASVWRLLQAEFPDGSIPAIADQTVITWGLQLRIGDALEIKGEDGTVHTLRLVAGLSASVFQGYLLVDIGRFTRMFPSTGGSEVFLVDLPSGGAESSGDASDDSSDEMVDPSESAVQSLRRRYRDHGLMVEDAAFRLSRFNVVQNSYLTIFLILGAIGMAVGTVGMSVIAARNIREDRSRIALLSAMGYRPRQVRVVVHAENLAPFLAGYLLGTVAAVTAILPRLNAEARRIDIVLPLILLGGILLWGILWILGITAVNMRGPLALALREE